MWLKMGPLAYPGAVGVVRDVTCSHGSSQHQHQPMQPPANTARRLQTNLLPLGAGPLRGPGCWPVRIPREKLAKFGKLLGGSRQQAGERAAGWLHSVAWFPGWCGGGAARSNVLWRARTSGSALSCCLPSPRWSPQCPGYS